MQGNPATAKNAESTSKDHEMPVSGHDDTLSRRTSHAGSVSAPLNLGAFARGGAKSPGKRGPEVSGSNPTRNLFYEPSRGDINGATICFWQARSGGSICLGASRIASTVTGTGRREFLGMEGRVGECDNRRVEMTVSDQGELRSLREWLASTAGAEVLQGAGVPRSGEQGALDCLVLLGSSTSLVAAIRVLPPFLRSRRSSIAITVTAHDRRVTVDAHNVDQVMPILERLLDD